MGVAHEEARQAWPDRGKREVGAGAVALTLGVHCALAPT